MPVKESTLRFKIEGLQDVQGAVGVLKQAARDMRADEVAVQRTHKVVQEALNAGKFPSEVARKNAVAAEENQQRTISNISFKTENDRRRTAVRFLDQQYSQDIESFKGNTEQKAAYEATYESKRRTLTDAIAGEEAKRAAERARIAQDEAKIAHQREVKRGQVILKEQMAEQKFAEQEKKTQNQKLIEADRYARKQELEQEKTTSRKEQDAIKLGKAESAAYDQEKKTQNQKLIEADRYARKQELEQEKTTSRKEQDAIKLGKAESAAYDMEAKRNAAGEGGGFFAKALGGFGGKMILGRAAGQMFGEISGQAGLGQAAGAITSAALFSRSSFITAGVAGIEVVTQSFRSYREGLQLTAQTTAEFAASLQAMTAGWSAAGEAMVERGPFAGSMEKEKTRAEAVEAKTSAEVTGMVGRGYIWANTIDAITGKAQAERDRMSTLQREHNTAQADIGKAEYAGDEAYKRHIASEGKILLAKREVYAIDRMTPGYLKQQAELNAKIGLEQAKVRGEHAESEFAAQQRLDKAREDLDIVRARINSTPTSQKSDQQARQDADERTAAERAVGDAIVDQNRRLAQNSREWADVTAKQDALRAHAAVARDIAIQSELAPYDLGMATAKHEREMADKRRELMDSAKAAYGESWWKDANWDAIQKQVDAEMRLYETGEQVWQQKRMRIELDSAALRITLRDAEIQRELAADPLTRGGRTEENAERYDAIVAAANAKTDVQDQLALTQITARIEQDSLAAKYAAHELSTQDYETQRLTNEMRLSGFNMEAQWVKQSIIDRTEAKEANDAEADTWRYKQSATETELQYMTKRHMISLKDADLARILLQDRTAYEAFETAPQKRTDAQKELAKEVEAEVNARERLRGTEMYNAGQFSTKYSAGYVNFAALNQNRMYGALRGPGSFETGQAGQMFQPSTFTPRWDAETPGSKGGPDKLDEICRILERIADHGGLN